MKKILISIALVLGNIFTGLCDGQLNIVPAPNKVVKGEGRWYQMNIAYDKNKNFRLRK